MKRIHPRRSEGREKTYRGAAALGWLFTLAIVIAVLCLFFFGWFRPMRISGDSMSPALEEGDIVLVDQLGKYWRQPVRGDIILFEDDYGAFIKRVVALPGERVDIQDGHVFIDSRPLDESAYAGGFIGSMEPVIVEEGAVFVLGDNRALMYDSRMDSVGCIPYEAVRGVLRVRVAPFARFTIFF